MGLLLHEKKKHLAFCITAFWLFVAVYSYSRKSRKEA
jgi:hypothetical protein